MICIVLIIRFNKLLWNKKKRKLRNVFFLLYEDVYVFEINFSRILMRF